MALYRANAIILRRRSFGLGQILILNALTPLFRVLDRWLPVPPLSLIAVMRKHARAADQAILQASTLAAAP